MPRYTTSAPLPKSSLRPKSIPAAVTHLDDEEKTVVDFLIHGYVVGVLFPVIYFSASVVYFASSFIARSKRYGTTCI